MADYRYTVLSLSHLMLVESAYSCHELEIARGHMRDEAKDEDVHHSMIFDADLGEIIERCEKEDA